MRMSDSSAPRNSSLAHGSVAEVSTNPASTVRWVKDSGEWTHPDKPGGVVSRHCAAYQFPIVRNAGNQIDPTNRQARCGRETSLELRPFHKVRNLVWVGSLRSVAKQVPALHTLARWAGLTGAKARHPFYTASPDLLVALVRAFNIQKSRLSAGQNLLEGHGYYEFGLFKGFSFWFADQLAREYAGPTFRLHDSILSKACPGRNWRPPLSRRAITKRPTRP
jgi:hypothetical protein